MGNQPKAVAVKAGETLYYCRCGASAKQPLCDGSHEDTEFMPMPVSFEQDETVYFCMCRQSEELPFCDGTHKTLLSEDEVKLKIHHIQSKSEVANTGPEMIALQPGKEYYWCSCGKSKNQTFCDGSHQGSDFMPLPFKVKSPGRHALCRCKKTNSLPFCDGAHKKLKQAKESQAADNWHKVAEARTMREKEVKPITVNGVKLALVFYQGQYNALDNNCPHQGGPLSEGVVECGKDNDCWVVCPWHKYEFHPHTGKAPAGHDDEVKTYPTEERADGIYVQISAAGKKAATIAVKDTNEEPYLTLIHEMAANGLDNYGAHGPTGAMGVPRTDLPQWQDIQILTAQLATRPLLDNAEVATRLTIGPAAKKPLVLDIPLFVSDMSFGALSREAKISLATGAELAGTGICSGEGGMLEAERAHNSRYFYELASAMFGYSEEHLSKVQAFHFKGGQAAKTGTGGHLPGNKVTAEIAKVRGLTAGQSAISPATFIDLRTAADFKKFAERVRAVSGGIPVGFKISANHIEDDIDFALAVGVDYIILDGRGGGTGAAPLIFRDNISVPSMAAISRARAHLDWNKADNVTLIATGGLRIADDFIKAMALGADGVALSNSALQAIGCVGARICNTNQCPTGIATQKEELRQNLNIDESAAKLDNYLRASVKLMQLMARACGHNDLQKFNRYDLGSWHKEIAELAGIGFVGGR